MARVPPQAFLDRIQRNIDSSLERRDEILKLTREGLSVDEIAARMSISRPTVIRNQVKLGLAVVNKRPVRDSLMMFGTMTSEWSETLMESIYNLESTAKTPNVTSAEAALSGLRKLQSACSKGIRVCNKILKGKDDGGEKA